MSLCGIIRNAVLAATMATGCAVPKAVCTYSQGSRSCEREYDNAFVKYEYEIVDNREMCAVYVEYKGLDYIMALLDWDCDKVVDVFAYDEAGNRQKVSRESNEEYFKKNFDNIFKDEIFDDRKNWGKKK